MPGLKNVEQGSLVSADIEIGWLQVRDPILLNLYVCLVQAESVICHMSSRDLRFPRDHERPDLQRTSRKRREKGGRYVVKTILYYITRRGLKGSRGATVEKITQVDRQRELITLWLLPMMKREGERMFVVGEIVPHPNKSWRLNFSATPQRAWSKGFLSWNLEDERGTGISETREE
ncbi:hypothetical protein AVEN_274730-1 [Araneus ventricosus]|uniref:Uncharacterized protein n=1 Tax=Araneus ventricosus TaxID=182803 RepID=A0A4Y2NWM1_ARAVE|nr:hypothetical protein AVEN_274730-1 [Araneus ventricosus]